ncbi:MAG TPA: hypothetical protein P5216_05415, partial [Bacteroidota bacterium]|nr:hypothetical protein [Bacteroidota bacterium]
KIIENAYMYLEVGSNEAHIKIQGAQNKKCTIILTNLFGIELMKIYDGILDFNDMNITFNVKTLSSGTYFCIIKIEDNQKILKFNMTK